MSKQVSRSCVLMAAASHSAKLLSAALILSVSAGIFAEEPTKQAENVITGDLFDDLPAAKPVEKPADAVPTAPNENVGEDVNFGSAQDPFADVARKMQRSQASLDKRELTADSNSLREEIVSDLDKLLHKMKQQCSGGQCNKPSNCESGNCPKPGSNSKPGQAGKKPAADSSKRVDKPASSENKTAEDAELLRSVWGHLPPKLREAMQNASFEEYLPKYEQHIRDYYRRLAEETRDGTK